MEILAIITLSVLVYGKTINYSPIVDDVPWLNYLRKLPKLSWKEHKVAIIRQFFKHRLYGAGTFEVSRGLGDKPKAYNIPLDNAVRIGLFALSGVLMYLALGKNTVAFWAAILFILNPINNQVSLWKNGRRFIVNINLVLGMMCLGGWGIALYFLTPLLQISAIFSPILMVGQSPWFLLAIPIVLAIGWREIQIKIKERLLLIGDEDRLKFTPKRLIIIVKYFGHYFFRMPIPGRCLMIYPTLHYWGRTEEGNKDAYSFNFDFFKGVAGLLISVGLIYILPSDLKPLSIFMLVATLQWSAVLPFVQDLADRYVSLPNVFMMFFVSYFINTYAGAYALPILVGIAVYYACNLFIVMRQYVDYPSHWFYHRYFSPAIPSPRTYEISFLMKKNDYTRAWTLIQEGLAHTPNDYMLLRHASICHQRIGDIVMAKKFAEEASRNYYLYQKASQEPQLKEFIQKMDDLLTGKAAVVDINRPLSRQERRAKERDEAKRERKK